MTNQVNQSLLVYLDQNVLSELSRGKQPGLFELFRSKQMQLIYSYMHIEETARCKNTELHSLVTDMLREVEAAYLHQDTLYFDKSPMWQLEECLSMQSDTCSQVETSMKHFVHKFFGGQSGKDLQDLADAQRVTFAGLMSHMSTNIEALEDKERDAIKYEIPLLQVLPAFMERQLEENMEELLQTLNADIPSSANFNATAEFRSFYMIEQGALNYIQPPQVMGQIWEKLIAGGKFPPNFNGAEDFLRELAKAMGSELTMETKISLLYGLLNMLGYWPDRKLAREDKFQSAISDQTHAIGGAYAHILITSDERMAKKVFAIYEYLERTTHVCLLGQDEKGKFTLLIGEEIFAST